MIPSAFTQHDTDMILSKYIQLKENIRSSGILVSREYLERCTAAFRDTIVAQIQKNPHQLIISEESQAKSKQKKQKGKSKAAEKQPRSMFTEEATIKHLKSHQLLPQEFEPTLARTIYSLLKDRLTALADSIHVELFASKKSTAVDLVADMQSRVEEQISLLQVIYKSYEKTAEVPNLNLMYLKQQISNFARAMTEQLVLLCCQRSGLQLPHGWFKAQSNQTEQAGYEPRYASTVKNSVFKSKDVLYQASDRLPKDIGVLMRRILGFCQ